MTNNQDAKTNQANADEGLPDAVCYAGFKGWLLKKWDWWIYYRSQKSIQRMCKSDPAYGYLYELRVRDWNARQHMSDGLIKSTEMFHNSLRSMTDTI